MGSIQACAFGAGFSYFDKLFGRADLGQLAAAFKQGAKQPSTLRLRLFGRGVF
jgi:hypothetical protein